MQTAKKTHEVQIGKATMSEIVYAFQNRIPIRGIHTFATHPGPHPEEVLFFVILKESNAAKKMFPGIENARIGQVTKTQMLKNNYWGKQGFFTALNAGILIAGLGGGYFDEHQNRDRDISAVQMLVEHLDLYSNKQDRGMFKLLVDYVNFEDNNSSDLIKFLNKKGHRLDEETTEILRAQTPGHFSMTLKKGFASCADFDDYKHTLYWGIEFFMIHIRQAKIFLKGHEEYEKNFQKIFLFKKEEKKEGFIIFLKSENPVMRSVVNNRWPKKNNNGLKVSVIVNAKQQFCISSHGQTTQQDMGKICLAIRRLIASKLKRKSANVGNNQEDWVVPEIYFDKNSLIISNGSNVDRDVEGFFSLIEEELVGICRETFA